MACAERVVEVGFWFEPVTFDSPTLGGPITAGDLAIIESVALAELRSAFRGLRITFSDRRDARYHVRVVQELQDQRSFRAIGGAGQSRAISGFGGSGAVSFSFLASGAMSYAPPGSDRAALIAAIGRAIGRTAVHEFTHQFFPTAAIHDSSNVRSYEYASAARPEHYYGAMEWDLAWPLLQQRFGQRR
jgi:hypothetical protein